MLLNIREPLTGFKSVLFYAAFSALSPPELNAHHTQIIIAFQVRYVKDFVCEKLQCHMILRLTLISLLSHSFSLLSHSYEMIEMEINEFTKYI